MDIEQHLHLRSFEKPTTNLYKAIVVAIVIHALLGFNFLSENRTYKAEMPDFINVKLTAGFENIREKEKPVIKKTSDSKKEIIKPVKKNKTALAKEEVQQPVVEKENEQQSKATTFVAADSRPFMLENPKPVYPASARRRGMQGVVLLRVKVNKKGYVKSLNILRTSGYRILDRSAVSSVENWRFIPAKRGDEYVASTMEIPIRFVLENI